MRILALTSSYPRFDGDPTAPFIESITRSIALRGHTTHLVLPEHTEWRRSAAENGIVFHVCRYSPRSSWTPWGYSESLERGVKIRRPLYALAPVVAISMLRTGDRAVTRESIDLVHAHWVIPNGPIGARVASRHDLPLVVSLHGSDVSVAQGSRWIERAARWTFERAHAVTAPSEDLLERARALGAKGDLRLVPYGGDADGFLADPGTAAELRARLGLADDDIAVLGVGRLVHWKGFDDLIEAVGRARAATPRVKLVLVGDGDLRGPLEQQARLSGLDTSITFVGMTAHDEIPGYLAAADIVVVPSVHYDGYVDGLPNVALEAMAAARPLVATRVGGLPAVIDHGANGLLVDERDPQALSEAIVTLARHPERRAAMGAAGRARVTSELSWDTVADRFIDTYDSVLTRRTRVSS